MSEHLSGRLDHSPPRTRNKPNTVPMEDVSTLREETQKMIFHIHIKMITSLSSTASTRCARFPSSCGVKVIANTPNQYPERGEPPSTWAKQLIRSQPTGSGWDVKHCSTNEDSLKLQLNSLRKQVDKNCNMLSNMQ